jgi:hypothetical protein
MRILAALLIALCALSSGVFAQPGDPRLKPLYDAHRWFQLRNAVNRDGANLFYQAAIEAAFNQPHPNQTPPP